MRRVTSDWALRTCRDAGREGLRQEPDVARDRHEIVPSLTNAAHCRASTLGRAALPRWTKYKR